MSDEQILVIENFLVADECQEIIEQFDAARVKGTERDHHTELLASDIDMSWVVADVVDALRGVFDPGIREDLSMLFETRPGGFQPLHADAEKQGEDGEWIPNHASWRTHVGMLYLTTEGEDHIGGVLRLPEVGKEYPPQEGTLIGFPATREYVHEVTPVESGTRYALAVWTERS